MKFPSFRLVGLFFLLALVLLVGSVSVIAQDQAISPPPNVETAPGDILLGMRSSRLEIKSDTEIYLPLAIREYPTQPPITPTFTPTHTPTPTPTSTHTNTPTSTPTFTRTPTRTRTSTPTPTDTPPTLSAIIVDHHNTDINAIPDEWIAAAKNFVVHYAHTSHGSQVLSGLEWLENQDSKYNVDIEAPSELVLPGDTTALRFYDGNNYDDDNYILPEMYWESTEGIDHTRSVADTGWFDFSLWTWCGQMGWYSEEQIQNYLDVMAQFETEYPSMRFIYYTGHTDGTGPGSDYWRNYEMTRQYVQDNQKVLFDFADIEVYAPDGSGPYYNDVDGYCQWCEDWCSDHSDAFECQNLDTISDCAHTHGLFCTLKGQAFWVLMARLAGWDGTR